MTGRRVVVVSRRFWPLMGEAEFVAANLAEEIQRQDNEVRVVTSRVIPQWPSTFKFRSFPVYRLPTRFPTFRARRLFERSCIKFIRESAADLDAAIFVQSGFPDIELLSQLGKLDIKCIVRLDGELVADAALKDDWSTFQAKSRQLIDEQKLVLVAPTEDLQFQLQKSGIDSSWIRDGIPDSDANTLASSEQKSRARIGLSQSHPLLRIRESQKLAVVAGPIIADQFLDRWIASWSYVTKSVPNAMIWIIGEGNIEQQLWTQIVELELENHVILGGTFDDLTDVFHAADLFLLANPRRKDAPFVLQAQSNHLPVLSETGHFSDDPSLYSPGNEFIETRSNNSVELAENICKLFTDGNSNEVSKKTIESARNRIRNFHNIDTMVSDYLKLI